MASAPGFRLRRSFVVDGLRGWRGVVWPRAANALGVGVVVVRRVEFPETVEDSPDFPVNLPAVLKRADLLQAGRRSLRHIACRSAFLQRIQQNQKFVFGFCYVIVDRHSQTADGQPL